MTKTLLIENINLKNFFFIFFFKNIALINNQKTFTLLIKKIFFFKNFFILTDNFSSFSKTDSQTREKLTKILKERKYKLNKNLLYLLDYKGSLSYFYKGSFHYLKLQEFYHYKYLLSKILPKSKIYIFKNNEILSSFGYYSLIRNIKIFDYIVIFKLLIKILTKYRLYLTSKIIGRFNYAAEVSNLDFFNKKFGEPNFIFDKKIIFFKTSKKNFAYKYKFDTKLLKNDTKLIDLRHSRILLRDFIKIFKFLINIEDICLYKIAFFENLLFTFIEYNYLFNTYNIRYCQITESSNDLRAINLESGIITSIAKNNLCMTFSYQTRSPYLLDMMNYYSYLDIYFSWSKFWKFNDKKINFISKIYYANPFLTLKRFKRSMKHISVFFHDVNNNTYSTYDYNNNFFRIIIDLAKKYKSLKFFLKPKFSHLDYKFLLNDLPNNCELIKDKLYSTSSLINKSDMVLCIGFTSPGTYAIAKNIPTLFYSELGSEHPINKLPITSNNKKDLMIKFEKILNNKFNLDPITKKLFINSNKKENFRKIIKNILFTNNKSKYV